MAKSRVKVFNSFIKSNFKHISIYAFLFLLVLIALKIRLTGLDQYYLTLDDTFDFANASYKNIIDVIKHNINRDGHPFFARIYLYFLHFITTDYMQVRIIFSIIPSIASIFLYYYIGKKNDGEVTGIVMAWVIAFSQVLVLTSQTFRHYSIYVLLFGIALHFILLYFKTNSKKHQYLYLLFAFICLYTHYQTAIVISAAAALITIKMVFKKEKKIQILEWVLLNFIILLTVKLYSGYQKAMFGDGGLFYTDNPSTDFMPWFGHWLRIFDQTFIENRTFTLFAFFFFSLGLIKLLVERKGLFLLLFFSVLAINIIAEFMRYYAFFTLTRRIVFYIPFIAFITGSGLNLFYILFKGYIFKKLKNKVFEYLFYIATGIVFLSISFLSYKNLKQTEFYRTPAEKSLYFMLPKVNYDLGMKFLSDKVGSNDIFFIDGLTANYFIYKIGRDKVIKVTKNVSKIEYNGWQIYFNDDAGWPRMDHPEHIKRNLYELDKAINLAGFDKIWYLNLSWDTALLSRSFTNFPEINLLIQTADDKYSLTEPTSGVRSLVIYSMKWENIKNILGVK